MKKILIVEDDQFLANAYKLAFDSTKYEILTMSDGERAADFIRTQKPDAVILDLLLPVKDGFSVLEEVKKDEKTKDIPIIIASNLGQHSDIERGRLLGANDYIVKSETSITQVVQKIENLLL